MEAILVFDYNNYLIYAKHNRLFLNEIADIAKANRLVSLECKSKIINLLQQNEEEFNNLIVLVFGPLVASIRILKDDCPKVDLFTSKNIQIISHSYLDYMFLLVFQSTPENVKQFNESNRKLDMFVDLTKLFYGVSINELENDQLNNVRCFLEFNMKCYEQYKDTPLFKLNAIERLIINDQIQTDLEKMCLHLIEQINEEPLLKEIPFQSMIFINDMLICNYKRPNSPKILHSDLILLTLMIKTYFCCLSDLEDKTLISSDSDYIASDDEDLDFICDHPYCELNPNSKLLPDFNHFARFNSDLKSIESRLESDRYLFDDCEHQLIFLHSYIDRTNLIPFLIRFMRINNEIIFVSLSELPSTFLYYYTNKLLIFFNGLQYSNPKFYGFSPLNQLENSIKKMQTCIEFIINDNDKRRNIQNAKLLKQKLDKFMKSDFRKYLLMVSNKSFQLSSRLEALVGAICVQLKEIANQMIFKHHHEQLNTFHLITINKLSKLKKSFLFQLRDYLSYIWVKSKRNLPIEPYRNLVSNLVLFIYVDRNRNEFIWSTDQNFDFECNSSKDANAFTNCLYEYKSMIYTLIDKSYQLLKTNQQMQSRWQEKNLIFNYAIWFEDHTGKLLNCNDKKFSLKSIPNLKKTNFIDEIVAQCFSSYKLVTNREFEESLTSSSKSSSSYSILKCFEIFYIEIKNSKSQKLINLDERSGKLSNEERFQVGNHCLNSLDLIQARRLAKKIAQTNSLLTKK